MQLLDNLMWFKRKPVSFEEPVTGVLGVEALLKQADRLRDGGDAPAAAEVYRKALALAPDRVDVKVQLGNMVKDSGHLREAEALYREAQAADPDDSDVCIQLGHVLKLMGNRAEAMQLYRRAAALNPNSWAAAEELGEGGDSWQQQKRFEVHFRAGGVEAVMNVSRQLAEMRATLDRLAATLPDALAQSAFPVDLYGIFRDAFTIPAPPPGPANGAPSVKMTAVLLADREPLEVLHAQLAAMRNQAFASWTLTVIGSDADRQRVVELAAAAEPRITWVSASGEDDVVVAEWKVARTVASGWLVLLAEGAVLGPQALAWFAAASRIQAAKAFIADQDECRTERGAAVRSAPVFRQVVDYDTLLEANVFGETIAVESSAYAAACPEAPVGSVTRARSSLLLALAADGQVGHIPFPLVSTREARRLSLPEHRCAIAAHLAGRGLAERVAVAKGETGPSFWRPAKEDAPIAVLISARGKAEHLRGFIRSLRELAEVPDALRFVVTDNASEQPETRALIEELSAKRYVTMLPGDAPFNGSACRNRAAAAVDAPAIVFADDAMLMVTERWDIRLRGALERDEIGALGARLLYGDDTLQHAGILFGWKNATINDGLYEPAEAPGPARRWQVTRATGAVTGAFLATRQSRFADFGGFDAVSLPLELSDIDYCLKLREAGLKILWTPAITLRHFEAKGEALLLAGSTLPPERAAAMAVLEERWGEGWHNDPSLHPIWYPATVPFRLIAAPSSRRVLGHIARTADRNPWAVQRVQPPSAK